MFPVFCAKHPYEGCFVFQSEMGLFYSIYDDLMLMNFYFVQVEPIGHGQYVSSFNNPNEVQIPCNRNVVW